MSVPRCLVSRFAVLPALVGASAALIACDATTPVPGFADVWHARSWSLASRANPSSSTALTSYPCGDLACRKFWLSIADRRYSVGAVVPAHATYEGTIDETPLEWDHGRATIDERSVTFESDNPGPRAALPVFPYSEPSLHGFVGALQGETLVLRGAASFGGSDVADVTIVWWPCSDGVLVGRRGQPGAWCRGG